MSKKIFFILFLSTLLGAAGLLPLLTTICFSQELAHIFENQKNIEFFDNKKVIFEAEVIGEPLKEKEGLWINVIEDNINVGIFVEDKNMINEVKHFGGYRVRGDRVKIEGVFYKRCRRHFERDIHAQSIKVVKSGGRDREEISDFKKKAAYFLAIICLTLSLIYLIKERYGKAN